MTEYELYTGCLKADEKYRKALFDKYLPGMYATCLRYANSTDHAEDMVQEGFIKIFSKLDSFKWNGQGSLSKWMKTIFINLAINSYRKTSRDIIQNVEDIEHWDSHEESHEPENELNQALEILTHEDIIESITELPEQFRIIFNLFAIEGMKHKEIAEMLNIPIQTSTTRYLRAKDKMKQILQKKMASTLQLH